MARQLAEAAAERARQVAAAARELASLAALPDPGRRASFDEGPLALPLSNLRYMENLYSYKKCQ